MSDPLVNMALKSLEDRMDAVEVRSKLLAGKTSEIAQILEVKTVQATQSIVEQAVDIKTAQVAQAVEDKAKEVSAEVSHKIEVERGKSKKEIETLNEKSIRRARRVFYIIMTIFSMMVTTAVMGFHAMPMTICLGFLTIAFTILTVLIINL